MPKREFMINLPDSVITPDPADPCRTNLVMDDETIFSLSVKDFISLDTYKY